MDDRCAAESRKRKRSTSPTGTLTATSIGNGACESNSLDNSNFSNAKVTTTGCTPENYASISCLDEVCMFELRKHISLDACLLSEAASKGWKACLPYSSFTRLTVNKSSDSLNFSVDSALAHDMTSAECAQRLRCLLTRVGPHLKQLSFHTSDSPLSDVLSSKSVFNILAKHAPELLRLRIDYSDLTPSALISVGKLSSLEYFSFSGTASLLTDGEIPDSIEFDVSDELDALKCVVLERALCECLWRMKGLKELRISDRSKTDEEYFGERPRSANFLGSVSAPLCVLKICVQRLNLDDLREFIRVQHCLVKLSIDVGSRVDELPPGGQSIIRALVINCLQLKRLKLSGLGAHAMDDVELLRGLESLVLYGKQQLSDKNVITMCELNPMLTKCIFDSRIVSKLAYRKGLAQLHHLERFRVDGGERATITQLDDATLLAVVKSNAQSLRFIRLLYQRFLTAATLFQIGLHCSGLEHLFIWVSWPAEAFPCCAPASIRQFAAGVEAGSAEKRVRGVTIEGVKSEFSDEFEALKSETPETSLVRLHVGGKTFMY